MIEAVITVALIIGAGYIYQEKLIDALGTIVAATIALPVRIRRRATWRLTRNCENKILGAISIAENAKHPLDGKNITAQCIGYYATYKFPCIDELSAWLAPAPRGVTIIHQKGENIIASIIDLTDASVLIMDKSEYVFEPLAFKSVDIDDLSGISLYDCRQLSSALLKPGANIPIADVD